MTDTLLTQDHYRCKHGVLMRAWMPFPIMHEVVTFHDDYDT